MLYAMKQWILEFYRREDGPTSVEYAIQLALIIALCVSSIGRMTSDTTATFNKVSAKLGSGSS
jgi:pilus assembly protein Flp/PilA